MQDGRDATEKGLRRLHEEAYAVAVVVRELYCVPTFNVKQITWFSNVWFFFFFGTKKRVDVKEYFQVVLGVTPATIL